MRPGLLLLCSTGLLLAACSTAPQYPVRPGEPRAELPKPVYPVHEQGGPTSPPPVTTSSPPPATPIAAAPAPRSGDDAPAPYKPQPILGSQAPQPDAGPPLRGHPLLPSAHDAPTPALETPPEVVVRPGESLFEVAERVRTPIRAIIDANGLKPPYDVTPGSTLKIPPPVIYAVKSGDTLFSISRRFSIDPRSLANLNDIAFESPLSPGQRLALPAGVKDGEGSATYKPAGVGKSAAPAISKPPLVASTPPKLPKPPVVAALAEAAPALASVATPTPPPPEPSIPVPTPAAALGDGKGKFIWPVKGEILSTFGPKGPGQRNDGINIAAKDGEPVRAAAGGSVVYAGNSLPGFGNLVVVKHADGWTSLYGNLGKMAVKIRTEVVQGQEIGTAGQSGAVDRPQVHFEVRFAGSPQEKARPVDPQGVLP